MRTLSPAGRWLSLTLVLALAAVPLPTPAADDRLEGVRNNFVRLYTGAGADPLSARWRNSLSALESDARRFMAAGYLRSDGSWTDIRYDEVPSGSWSPWEHTRRLALMAKAYQTPGHSLYRDPSLRSAVEAALSYVPAFYPATGDTPGNWWFWRIGIPLDLGPTLVLMQGEVSAPVLDAALRSMSSRIGPSPWYYPTANALKGQNLAWSAFTHLCLALVTNNESMMSASRDAMASVARHVSGGDGIQTDLSFHQHGPQLQTGSYGSSFAQEAARFILITRNTPYAMPQTNVDVVADFAVDGLAWGMYGSHFDVSIIGREVTKPWANAQNGLVALLQMSEVPSQRQDEIRAATAATLSSWDWTLPSEYAAVASRFGATMPAAPAGNRYLPRSDHLTHRRNGWFASIKMLSSRTRSGERTNGENIRGSRQSDGRLYLVLEGNEYFGQDVWPALDWARLPGITVERRPTAANDVYGTGSRSFVGAATDGRNGMAAMDFAAVGSVIEARKSWLFLDDSIVFMTSGVKLLNGNYAETIINQWPLSRSDAPVYVDGVAAPSVYPWNAALAAPAYAWADNIGYYFPESTPVSINRQMRQGAWSDLGTAVSSSTLHTKPVLTLAVDHGPWVSNGAASYVIVPALSHQDMQRWTADRPISILRNDNHISAARDDRTGTTGIVFWSSGSIEGISASRASVVYLTRSGNAMQLHVSDPTQATATVRLALPGTWALAAAPSGVTASSSGRTTTVDVPVRGGGTTSFTLRDATRRRRGVAPPVMKGSATSSSIIRSAE